MKGLTPFNRNNPLRRTSGFEDFYNVLDDFFTSPLSTKRSLMDDSFKLDIKDEKDKYVVEADLPGVKKEEINLQLDDGRLTISIEREEKEETKEKDYIHRERRCSSMSRSIYLGDVKDEEVNAKLENGILCIEIPKGEEKEKAKKIPIE
jgi:HSP20 family protein